MNEQLDLFSEPPPETLATPSRQPPETLSGRDRAERNTDDWWTAVALQAVRAMAATGRIFQCYDLVEVYAIPEPDHPNRWGALLTRAARKGLIVAVGAAPSRRPKTAGSLTRTWRGAQDGGSS